ncbi:MAG: hypothetical protein PHD84_09180 [Atribacterota bacterium]|nr:hypothetical protein [Atribacterota bacterium]
MKKINFLLIITFIFFCITFIIFFNFAQEQKAEDNPVSISKNTLIPGVSRNVLIELFINNDCTTCPKAAFCLEELTWSYEPGRVILVEAHIWDDGYDIPQTHARYDWYVGNGVKGTPDTFFNGLSERVQGLCCDCGDIDENITAYQEIIDKHLNQTSPMGIKAIMEICTDKIIIQGSITNLSHSLQHNLMLNGMVYYEGDESEFFYLVKDIFEEQDICQLAPLEERKFSFISHLDLMGIEDEELDRYYGVVFVQDRLTKEVLQSFLIY